MILCTRCGATNQPTSKFCLSCGAPLAVASVGPPGPTPQAAPPPPPTAYSPGAQPPAPPPQWGAPPPQYQPPQGPPPHYQPPQSPPHYQPPSPEAGPPPGWGGGYAQPPPAAAPPAWGAAPVAPPPAFAPTDPQPRYQAGNPDGLNPFAPTLGPALAPAGYGGQAPPPASPAYPPAGWGPPPELPHPSASPWGPPAPAGPPPGLHSHDPSVYAATAPPPTHEEFDRGQNYPPPPPRVSSAAPPPMMAADATLRTLAGFLISYEAAELGVFWPIYQGQNLIGRKGAAPGLDVEIDHPTTSSRHAVIHAAARPGRFRLEDPGSTNGTFLGEQTLEKNKLHDLRDGDFVRFGGFNVIVKII